MRNLSDRDNILTLQRYQALLADAWETKHMHCPFMLQKSINSFIHFRVPGTRKISKFTPKGGTDVCSSTLLQRGRRKLVFRQLRWCCRLTAQPAAPWLLTATSLAVSSEDQHSCKPELRAAGTGCAWVTLTLILQPEAVPCSSSHFRFGFKKICLLEARHEASTWGKKMKNMRVKAINHTVVSILYSCTEGNQEKHQQKQSKPEQRRKLSETETPSSSKN